MCGSPSVINKTDYNLGIHSNKNGKLKYPYYLCFSRTPSSAIGYPLVRQDNIVKGVEYNEMWAFLVRLTFDGSLLNANYRGKAVNFFNHPDKLASMWKNILASPQPKLTLSKDNDNFPKNNKVFVHKVQTSNRKGQAKNYWVYTLNGNEYKTNVYPDEERNAVNTEQGFGFWRNVYDTFKDTEHDSKDNEYNYFAIRKSEYEDRLFMRNLRLENVLRYVKNIDILLKDEYVERYYDKIPDIKASIKFIIDKVGYDKVHIMSTDKEFNTFNYQNDDANKQKFTSNEYTLPLNTESKLSFGELNKLIGFATACMLSFNDDMTTVYADKFADAIVNNYPIPVFSELKPNAATSTAFVYALKNSNNLHEYIVLAILALKDNWLLNRPTQTYHNTVENVFKYFRSNNSLKDVLTLLSDFFYKCTTIVNGGYNGIGTLFDYYKNNGTFEGFEEHARAKKKGETKLIAEAIDNFNKIYNLIQ